MKRNSRIAGCCLVIAAALLLASCGHKRGREEDLEDRITELEEENQYLRDQLEDAESPRHARPADSSPAEDGSHPERAAEWPGLRAARPAAPATFEPRREPAPDRPSAGDEDALEAAQRAVEDARNAEKGP